MAPHPHLHADALVVYCLTGLYQSKLKVQVSKLQYQNLTKSLHMPIPSTIIDYEFIILANKFTERQPEMFQFMPSSHWTTFINSGRKTSQLPYKYPPFASAHSMILVHLNNKHWAIVVIAQTCMLLDKPTDDVVPALAERQEFVEYKRTEVTVFSSETLPDAKLFEKHFKELMCLWAGSNPWFISAKKRIKALKFQFSEVPYPSDGCKVFDNHGLLVGHLVSGLLWNPTIFAGLFQNGRDRPADPEEEARWKLPDVGIRCKTLQRLLDDGHAYSRIAASTVRGVQIIVEANRRLANANEEDTPLNNVQ